MTTFRLATVALLLSAPPARAADWPQWGGGPTRNPVSLEKGLPLDFRFELTDDGKVKQKARGITWTAKVSPWNCIPPVVADGLVWVGSCGMPPADERLEAKRELWDGGVLMCFRESDGKLLWEHRTPRLTGKDRLPSDGDRIYDSPHAAIGSAPHIEGDRLWYVNNRSEVVCFDVGPLKKGTGKPTEVWKFDLRRELGVTPFCPYHDNGFGASVAVYNDKLYTITRQGGEFVRAKGAKDAPSLVCLEKATGKLVWKDTIPSKDILYCQMSSPLVAEINGKAQVIVGQGDGWLRSFDATTGKLVWKCDLNSKDAGDLNDEKNPRNSVVATPILYENRVYIATGINGECSSGRGCLYCVDPMHEGDVSLELPDGPKKGKPNPNTAVVWHTRGPVPKDAPVIETGYRTKRDLLRTRDYIFGRSNGGCVAHDGLAYAVEGGGALFCFDAKTGKLYWGEDVRAGRGQPLWVDGKVVVAADDGVAVFARGKEKKLVTKIEAEFAFYSGPVFANGTLYLVGFYHGGLYAIRNTK